MDPMIDRALADETFTRAAGYERIAAFLAARERVMDIRSVWDALHTYVPATPDLTPSGAYTSDLPIGAEPFIGISGWWQLTDTMAALVRPTDDPDVHHLHVITDTGSGLAFTGIAARITAVGDMWECRSTEVVAPSTTPLAPSEVESATRLTFIVASVVIVACDIAQAFPASVVASPLPPHPRGSGGRTAPPTPRSSIVLPGLRYDSRTHSFWAGGSRRAHSVRGFRRRLTSPYFTHKRGQTIRIAPHTRGDAARGTSTTPYTLT